MPTNSERVKSIAQHCADPYQGCCLPYKTPVTPNGWCVCICGDCRLAKYQEQEKWNEQRAVKE